MAEDELNAAQPGLNWTCPECGYVTAFTVIASVAHDREEGRVLEQAVAEAGLLWRECNRPGDEPNFPIEVVAERVKTLKLAADALQAFRDG